MTGKERLDRHDRQIAAIRGLVQEGMHLMVETRKDLRKLAEMQKEREQELRMLIHSPRRGGNGPSK